MEEVSSNAGGKKPQEPPSEKNTIDEEFEKKLISAANYREMVKTIDAVKGISKSSDEKTISAKHLNTIITVLLKTRGIGVGPETKVVQRPAMSKYKKWES